MSAADRPMMPVAKVAEARALWQAWTDAEVALRELDAPRLLIEWDADADEGACGATIRCPGCGHTEHLDDDLPPVRSKFVAVEIDQRRSPVNGAYRYGSLLEVTVAQDEGNYPDDFVLLAECCGLPVLFPAGVQWYAS